MGLFGRAEKRASTDSPASTWERDFPGIFGGGRRTFSGKRVTREGALSLIAVYACHSLITDGIATLPLKHYRKSGGYREQVPNSPSWVSEPNPEQTSVDFWTRVVASLLSDGNAFIFTLRADNGKVIALYCLHPQDVEIVEGDTLADTRYRVSGNSKQYDRSEILHIAGQTIGDNPRGMSPIDIAREAIGLGLTIEEYGARFFSQGTTMAGVIEHPGTPKPDEARLLREMFRKSHSGVKNSHAVGVLTGGAAFKAITITPEQAQFLETRRFQKAEIALLYRVPAYIVDPQVTSTWGSGIEEQNKFLVEYTFQPWAIRIEQAVSTFLLPRGQFVKFNFDARLRPKTKDRYEAYSKGIDAGFMCLDDVRALEDMPPLPDGQGQHFWRPANMVPVAIAINPPKPPAPSKDGSDQDDKDTENDAD